MVGFTPVERFLHALAQFHIVNEAKCVHPPKIEHFVKLVPIARRLALSRRFQVHVDMHR
jgi:hypothetical protein